MRDSVEFYGIFVGIIESFDIKEIICGLLTLDQQSKTSTVLSRPILLMFNFDVRHPRWRMLSIFSIANNQQPILYCTHYQFNLVTETLYYLTPNITLQKGNTESYTQAWIKKLVLEDNKAEKKAPEYTKLRNHDTTTNGSSKHNIGACH
jgi:hypothetical protein